VSCMMEGWHRPMIRRVAVAVMAIMLALVPIETFFLGASSRVMVVCLLLLLPTLLIPILLSWHWMRDIWSSEYRVFLAKGAGFSPLPVIEEALRAGGLNPVRREQRHYKNWMTLDVGRALNVTLVPTFAGYVAYVGPVRDDMRRDIDRIERAVDTAMESFGRGRERPLISRDTVEDGG